MMADNDLVNNLRAQLEAACKDLWWSSESDYPVEVVWQEVVWQPANVSLTTEVFTGGTDFTEATDDQIRRWVASCEPNNSITTVSLADFFKLATTPQSWHTAEDNAQRSQLQQLKDLLEATLTRLQVYRCGEIEVNAYILGVTSQGTLAGVKTTLVET